MGLPAIKNWKVQHETVVSLHISGYSNKKIAAATDMTPERVSQILSDPQAKAIITRVQKAMRLKMEEDIGDRLVVMAETGAKRLAETLDEEFILGSDGKKHQDNVALQVLKGTGFLNKEFNLGDASHRPPLDEMLAERLVTALEKSNEASEKAEIVQKAHEVPFKEVKNA